MDRYQRDCADILGYSQGTAYAWVRTHQSVFLFKRGSWSNSAHQKQWQRGLCGLFLGRSPAILLQSCTLWLTVSRVSGSSSWPRQSSPWASVHLAFKSTSVRTPKGPRLHGTRKEGKMTLHWGAPAPVNVSTCRRPVGFCPAAQPASQGPKCDQAS